MTETAVVEESNSEMVKGLLESMSDEDKKGLKGWYLYDFANQAFALTVVTVVAPMLTASLFNTATGGGTEFMGANITGASYYSLVLTASSLFIAICSPILGVIADRVPIKKKILWVYTLVGVIFTALMGLAPFMGDTAYIWLAIFIVIGNIGFAGGNVIYYAFMPYLAPREAMDRVSSVGYVYGFVGGCTILIVHLAVLMAPLPTLVTLNMKMCFVFVTSALWWFGWGLPLFRHTPEPEIPNPTEFDGVGDAVRVAVKQVVTTFREIKKFPVLSLYLISYLLFYDGVNTIAAMASAYGDSVLRLPPTAVMFLLLTVNFVAIPMSYIGGLAAERYGTKEVLGTALIVYCIAAILATGFAPLPMEDNHEVHDFQFDYNDENEEYSITVLYDKTACCTANSWFSINGEGDAPFREVYFTYLTTTTLEDAVSNEDYTRETLPKEDAANMTEMMVNNTDHRFSFSFVGGPEDGKQSVGDNHPANLGEGPLDGWAMFMRDNLWGPLGMTVTLQFIFLGMMVGMVMGTAGAQARSMFSMLIPRSRTTEFFGFFGFIGKAAAVIGPLVYAMTVAVSDDRVAILTIVAVILLGTVMFTRVDIEKGVAEAEAEDARNFGLNTEGESEGDSDPE